MESLRRPSTTATDLYVLGGLKMGSICCGWLHNVCEDYWRDNNPPQSPYETTWLIQTDPRRSKKIKIIRSFQPGCRFSQNKQNKLQNECTFWSIKSNMFFHHWQATVLSAPEATWWFSFILQWWFKTILNLLKPESTRCHFYCVQVSCCFYWSNQLIFMFFLPNSPIHEPLKPNSPCTALNGLFHLLNKRVFLEKDKHRNTQCEYFRKYNVSC